MDLPEVLLLDLDDTILDSYGNPDDAWSSICLRFAGRMSGVNPRQMQGAIAESRDMFWADESRARRGRLDLHGARREIVRRAFTRLGIAPGPLADEMADRFTIIREEAVKPLPGALETLRELRHRGIRLGLLTNGQSRHQRRKLDRFGLDQYFDHVQIEEEFAVGKPVERAFLHALQVLGSQPIKAWMVGDNLEHDVGGAQRVGIHAVWVDASGEGLPQGAAIKPDHIIRALPELLA